VSDVLTFADEQGVGSAAFNCVDHALLMLRLRGLTGDALRWMK